MKKETVFKYIVFNQVMKDDIRCNLKLCESV